MPVDKEDYSFLVRTVGREHTEPRNLKKLSDIRVRASMTRAQGVGGFLSFLVHIMQPRVILEIGTARGYTAICMAISLLREDSKIWSVDVVRFRQQSAIEEAKRLGLSDKIEFIYRQSAKVKWTKPIDLLFLDGNHSYQHVHKEFYKFSPHVTREGIIVLHDSGRTHHSGVRKVIEDHIRGEWNCIQFEQHPGLTLCQRPMERLHMVLNSQTRKWTYKEDKQ